MSFPVPRISIVIPTFNRRRQLATALESALAQTWEDREIVVVDDGSTDHTIEGLALYWNRIRYHRQENRGAAAAQNQGWRLARGEWVAILADDDLWEPRKLERQVEALDRFGDRFGACFTNCRFTGNPFLRDSAFDQAGFRPDGLFSRVENPVDLVLRRHPAIFVQSLIVRRSLLFELEGFDESLIIGEDTDLLFRLAHRTEFCCVDECLVGIDRTPARTEGLADILNERSDRLFAAQSVRLQKWLQLTDCVDQSRSRIIDDLKEVHYCWAISRLYKMRFLSAFANIREVSRLGSGSGEIVEHLLSRVNRRLKNTWTRFREVR